MTKENFDLETKNQLKILNELSTIFKNENLDFWLRGGWTIDFILGKVTRIHSDIDLCTWITNREKIEHTLIHAGFKEDPVNEPFRNRQSDFVKENVYISICYLTYDRNNNLILNELPEWVWREESLSPKIYHLHGITAKTIHPKQLLEEKKIYREIGRPHRKKDEESMRILRQILAEYE